MKFTHAKSKRMAELFVELKYGNCSAESEVVSQKVGDYDHLIERWKGVPFPANDSVEVMKELQTIQKAVTAVDAQMLTQCLRADRDLAVYIHERLEKRIDFKLIKRLVQMLGPSVLKLKKHYQRPRPFQLGYVLNQPVFPFASVSAHSPAYPSGHTAQARFACNMLATLYPHTKKSLEDIQQFVADSRIRMGVHYPSDNEFGYDFADDCYDDPKTEKVLENISDYL